MKTVLKVCGITRLIDAEQAVQLGANALGFVFAESPRKIRLEVAKEIIACLASHILCIGVFQDENFETISSIVEQAKLTGIQLHGSETASLVHDLKLKFPSLLILKMLRPESAQLADTFNCDAILLEPVLTQRPIRAAHLAHYYSKKPLYLAGGISAKNILELLQQNPDGIDLSSSLECSAGMKDYSKMEIFFAIIRGQYCHE